MKNKENNKNVTIDVDVFSTLANLGWVLTLLKACGVITQLPWHAILGYWLALLGISVAMGILTALVGLWTNKGGEK